MFARSNSRRWKVRAGDAGVVLAFALVVTLNPPNLSADCPDPPTEYPSGVIEGVVSTGDEEINSTVGMDAQGRFLIAWPSAQLDPGPWAYNRLLVHRFAVDGECICESGDDCPARLSVDEARTAHSLPSVALSPDGLVSVNWLGGRVLVSSTKDGLLHDSFDFDLSPFVPPARSVSSLPDGDYHPSAGVSDYLIDDSWNFYTVAWARPSTPVGALLYWDPVTSALRSIVECGSNGDECFPNKWQPTVAMRGSDGVFAICWAAAEQPTEPFSEFNIKLQLYGTDGEPIGEEITVNQPLGEELTSEVSPAVAFDEAGNLVVVWVGGEPTGCNNRLFRIFGRRLYWSGSGTPLFQGNQFMVDSVADWDPVSAVDANPTVALSMDTENPGKFIIAWNAVYAPRTPNSAVRALYFDADGAPVGQEFQLNQAFDEYLSYRLANSGQHTLAYGADGQVVATWSKQATYDGTAYFTILPAGFAETTGDSCCKGDVNADGHRNGLDIQPFVDLLLGDGSCLNILELCPADLNNDATIDTDDIPLFVYTLLDGAECSTRSGGQGLEDCNGNVIPDANDIHDCPPEDPSCQDCNANWVPDECDIAEETSADVNENGIPDECETDCNSNGYPDDYDIAQQTSADLDSNGVPDECEADCNKNDVPDYWDIDPQDPDGNELVSADCNENSVPDECEPDCNANGVPDDCDIDPTDPDGDEWVSPDCNENEYPDECDIALGPGFGSTDCNDNDIPDECDIADCDPEDPDCQDCNANGYPDSCDIAAEISLDEDENGIPDECEGGGDDFAGGTPTPPDEDEEFAGGTPTPPDEDEEFAGGTPTLPGDPEAYFDAWIEYYEWLDEQEWGPDSELTGAEQFRLMVDKLIELGLPVRNSP